MRRTPTHGNLRAAGIYLRTIREGRGYSRVKVAAVLHTNESQIIKIEAGTIDTRATSLMALIAVLDAGPDELLTIMLDHAMTPHDARARGHARLAARPHWRDRT